MRFTLAAAAALLPLAARAVDIPVAVGQNGLTFEPSSIEAAVGDVVVFTFYPKNHTVTQSTFAEPCTQAPNGAHSGFREVSAGATTAETWSYTVQTTNATWWYCAQGNHCNAGMVFAINPTEERTFEAFSEAATNATSGPVPTAPAASGGAGSSSTGTNRPTGTNTNPNSSPSPSGDDDGAASRSGVASMSLLAGVAALMGLAL